MLDFVLDEDQTRNRNVNGPECLAALRRIALNIMHVTDGKNSPEGRMRFAATGEEYPLGLLPNAVSKFLERASKMYGSFRESYAGRIDGGSGVG